VAVTCEAELMIQAGVIEWKVAEMVWLECEDEVGWKGEAGLVGEMLVTDSDQVRPVPGEVEVRDLDKVRVDRRVSELDRVDK